MYYNAKVEIYSRFSTVLRKCDEKIIQEYRET